MKPMTPQEHYDEARRLIDLADGITEYALLGDPDEAQDTSAEAVEGALDDYADALKDAAFYLAIGQIHATLSLYRPEPKVQLVPFVPPVRPSYVPDLDHGPHAIADEPEHGEKEYRISGALAGKDRYVCFCSAVFEGPDAREAFDGHLLAQAAVVGDFTPLVPAVDTISAERVEETGGHPGWRVAEILCELNTLNGSSFRDVIAKLPEYRKGSDFWDEGVVIYFELTDGTEISRTRRPLGPWAVTSR